MSVAMRPRRLAIGLLAAALLATVACGGSASRAMRPAATASSTDRWRPLHDSILSRSEVGAARIGRFIYVVGGFVAPLQTTGAVERYDIKRDRWSRVTSMPIAVNHPAVAALKGRLFVYGGYTDSSFGPVTGALQVYRPRKGSWKLLPSSPTPRAAAALVQYGGPKLYAIGGANSGGALGTVEVFDLLQGAWHRNPPLSVAREHIAAAYADGSIYVFGGRAASRNLRTVERYRRGADRWQRMPPLRTARSGIAAVTVGDKPVVFGGEELTPGGTTIRPVELFDPERRRWQRLPGMLTPRHGLGGAALGRRVYSLEGGPQPGGTFSDVIEYLDLPRRLLR
jgi:N-acetylneuraminic acid mutarotase